MTDSSYSGQNVEFKIYEDDLWPDPDDYVTTKYAQIDRSFAETSWVTVWQSDYGGPEFKFTFKIPSASLQEDSENELHVSQDTKTEYYAVIVGENDYPPTWEDNDFSHLAFPEQGATDFYNNLNFSGETHKVLLKSADKSEIKAAINNYKNMMDEGDIFIFYYAGHGWDGESSYWLVPVGHEPEPSTSQMISGDELYNWFKSLPTSRIAVVLVSCYSGGVAAYLAQDPAAFNDFEILAASGRDESLYLYEARAFNDYLIEGLKGAATDYYNNVNIGSLYMYTKDKLKQENYTFTPTLGDGYFSGDITLAHYTKTCTPGAKRCMGNSIQTCNSQGSGWETTQDCGISSYCSGGLCNSCSSGYKNCNKNPSDVCEINTLTDDYNCGSCGNMCPSDQSCQNGQCVSLCSCTSWQNQDCGTNNCAANEVFKTRTCAPGGCNIEEKCEYEESCVTGTTITVCKSGCNYNVIQAGLNAASSGDIIIVKDQATYYEQINWPRNGITLDCNGATLDGTGQGMKNFSCVETVVGIMLCNKNYNVIKNCKIVNYIYSTPNFLTGGGIYLMDSKNNKLINNHVESILWIGIHVYHSDSNLIEGNTILNTTYLYSEGIWLSGLYNIIRNNYIKNHPTGITMSRCNYTTVEGNTISQNSIGLDISYRNYHNTISNNIFCPSNNEDFDTSSTYSADNHGTGNTCSQPENWNDDGTTGCTYSCGGIDTLTVCKSGACDYTTIQEALNAATSNLHTIKIWDTGIYEESVTWPKLNDITLDCNGAALKGSGGGIGIELHRSSSTASIGPNGSIIRNCIIVNYSEGINMGRNYFTEIHNNIFTENSRGIDMETAANQNKIFNNEFYNNDGGIELYRANESYISSNVFENNWEGITLSSGASLNNIQNNIFENNERGIWITSKELNYISTSNTLNGKPVKYYYGADCPSIIENQDLTHLTLVSCNGKIIRYNKISYGDGLNLVHADNTVVYSNNIYKNYYHGIELYYSDNTQIYLNNVTGSKEGISLDSDGNNVYNNNLFANGVGIYLGFAVKNNQINSNVFCPSNENDFGSISSNPDSSNTGDNNKCDRPQYASWSIQWNDIGATGCTYSCKQKFSLSLDHGWNLVSIPLNISNNTLPEPFKSIYGNYSKVFTYNYKWIELKNGSRINETIGLWIYITKDDILEVDGYKLNDVIFDLSEGWNLIGYPYLEEKNISELFGNVVAYMYNNSKWYSYEPNRPSQLNTLTKFTPGYGYWVKK